MRLAGPPAIMSGLRDGLGTPNTDIRALLRLGTAFGIVLAGATLIGFGLLRVGSDALIALGASVSLAETTARMAALAIVPGLLLGLRLNRPAGAGSIPLSIGVIFVGITFLALWALPSTGWPGVLAIYAGGTGLILAGVLAGEIVAIERGTTQAPIDNQISYRRDSKSLNTVGSAADGGEDDEDLEFPLDDDN